MRTTRRWFLLVAAYTLACGAPLLLAPHHLPIAFEPSEEVWVRVLGMVLVGMSIYQFEMFRSGRPFMLRAGLLHQLGAVIGLGYVASTHESTVVRWALAVVLAVLVGGAIAYLKESKGVPAAADEPEFVLLPRTARWNLYVMSYTLAYGILGAFAPLLIFPLLGFPRTDGLWIRAAGFAFLVLSHFNLKVYLAKGSARYIFAIYLLRCFIVVVLVVMTLAGYAFGLGISAVIVGIGVVGTTISYFPEIRRVRATTAS